MIEPAVDAQTWNEIARSPWPIDSYIADTPNACAYVMALNNHALPDGSVYKFTRADVALLRRITKRLGEGGKRRIAATELADRIAAYLPPDVP